MPGHSVHKKFLLLLKSNSLTPNTFLLCPWCSSIIVVCCSSEMQCIISFWIRCWFFGLSSVKNMLDCPCFQYCLHLIFPYTFLPQTHQSCNILFCLEQSSLLPANTFKSSKKALSVLANQNRKVETPP